MVYFPEKCSALRFSFYLSLLLLRYDRVSSYVDYNKYKLLSITPIDINQVIFLREMQTRLYSEISEVDFWGEPRASHRSVIVSVGPSKTQEIRLLLEELNISYTVVSENLKEMIDDQMNSIQQDAQMKEFEFNVLDDFAFDKYHNYNEINEWMLAIAEKYPDLVSLNLLTDSYEGKPIYLMTVSGNNFSGEKKLAAYIQSGTHAREWVGPATVIYFINQLITRYNKDTDITIMMDTMEWYIITLHNIDGYAFSWTTDRLWRKTRSPNDGSTCVGTDPNRNWDFMWGGEGSSGNPCSDIYHGESPFSEVEVRKAAEFVESRAESKEIVLFLDVHSYSQLWLAPYGYTTDLPTDFVEQMKLSQQVVDAIRVPYGTEYLFGPSSLVLYIDSGSSNDWAYGAANITHSYTIELRPDSQSKFGFILPEEEIIPTATEAFEGLKAAAAFILNKLPAS